MPSRRSRRDEERPRLTPQARQAERLRAIGQMASGILHDVNQSLGLVVAHAELALQDVERGALDPTEMRASLHAIVETALHGSETLKRLLRFARAHEEGPAVPVRVADLLADVARLTAPRWKDATQAEGRPIHLHVRVQGSPIVAGWPDSLREALFNLVLNAVDALPRGGEIRLTAARRAERVEIGVADSGVGMPPEVQAQVFDPFFSTKGERGTGLGLPQVYQVVERHGGEVSLTSAPGEGTLVRLSFPLWRGTDSAPADAAAAGAPPAPALRILLVDDEAPLARAVARLLVRAGHRVSIAPSGEDALDLLARTAVDVVVSDLVLGPGINGWELARRVRERGGPRVVLATGFGTTIDPDQAREHGVDAVVAKPYRLADLLRAIEEPAP